MTRVYIVVEGPTEESFVKNVLAESLWSSQVNLIPRILGVPGHKGGRPNYERVKKDVIAHLKQETAVYCSTMLDFCGLGSGFPGMPLSPNLPKLERVRRIEEAVKQDICQRIPEFRPEDRFLPYLQLHEYEGLLFSNPQGFAEAIKQPNLAHRFVEVRNGFATPEDINDGPTTSPSKRVLQAYPAYEKVIDGTRAARAVGIEAMRRECPHFREWLERLETLDEA